MPTPKTQEQAGESATDDGLIDRPNRSAGQVIVEAIVEYERAQGASWRS
jgi:hypothetical protein